MAKKRDDDADGVDNPMYTMSKVGGAGGEGWGILRNGGMFLKWEGLIPLYVLW